MESVEAKRKSVPGARDIVMQIRTISDSIQSIDNEIKSNIEKVSALIEAGRANSKKGGVLAEFRAVSDELQNLRAEKKMLFDELSSHKESIEKLKEMSNKDKNSLNIRNPEDIDRKIEQLDVKLISDSVSAADEKKIAAELLQLRSMKSKLGDLEESRNKIKDITMSVSEIKTKINELIQVITAKTAEKDKIKIELDKLSSTDKVKSPEVQKLEAKIAALKAQKQTLLSQKNERKEAVRALEAEWAQFEIVLQEQIKLEEQKSSIKKIIQELRNKKEELCTEIAGFDPKIFDTLYYSASALKKTKCFSINISLVGSLMKYNIKVPSNADEVDETLAQISEKKSGSMSSFKTRNEVSDKEIAAIDAQIAEAQAKLNELPPTDFDILRKGGRSRKY